MQNYEVQPGHKLIIGGRLHSEGDVLPAWYVNRDNGLDARVERAVLAPTAKLAMTGLAPLEAKTAGDPNPAIQQELDRVTQENAEFADSNRELSERLQDLEKKNKELTKGIGDEATENAHLRAACEEHQAARDMLETKAAALEAKVVELNQELNDLLAAPATPSA